MLEVIKWYKGLKWKIGLIPRVEILKLASKMATSNVLKIYLTNKLDKKHLILTFLWLFRGLMIQAIKIENWFGSESSNI